MPIRFGLDIFVEEVCFTRDAIKAVSYVGFMLLNAATLASCASPQGILPAEVGQVVQLSGTVIQVDSSQMAVDGPARITLAVEGYSNVVVFVAACEGPCSLSAVQQLPFVEPGEIWQVRGEVRQDGGILIDRQSQHSLEPAGG